MSTDDINPPRQFKGVEKDLMAAELANVEIRFIFRPDAPSPFEFWVEREEIRPDGKRGVVPGTYIGLGRSCNTALQRFAKAVSEDDYA